jgi:hypothetical protein
MYAEIDCVSGTLVVSERSVDEICFEVLQKQLALPGDRNRPVDVCIAVMELYRAFSEQWEQHEASQRHESTVPPPITIPAQPTYFQPGQYHDKNSNSRVSRMDDGQVQPDYHAPAGFATTPPSASLSSQALEVLNAESSSQASSNVFQDGSSMYDGSSYLGGSSMYDGSSYYDASTNDSTKGILEALTAESVASSVHDDAYSDHNVDVDQPAVPPKSSSSWFRFGSRKSKYCSPSSRVSMIALQEGAEMPSEEILPQPLMDSFSVHDAAQSVVSEEKASSDTPAAELSGSRSWFGFGRRSNSPGRMLETSRHGRTRSRSPESPASGDTALESEAEYSVTAQQQLFASDDSNAIEVSLNNMTTSDDGQGSNSSTIAEQTSNSYSWFGFRRSKSPSSKREADNNLDETGKASSTSESIISTSGVAALSSTEKSDEDADWLHEVMSQSTGTNNDDLKSADYVSWLDHDKDEINTASDEGPQSSRGQSSWFGFKRSKKTSRFASVSDYVEEKESQESTGKPPELVSVDFYLGKDGQTNNYENGRMNETDTGNYMKSPTLGVSWFLGEKGDKSLPEDHFFVGRSRLPTESTIHTVSTDEPVDEADDDIQEISSGEDFTEEFEKGVAQSFAYLEI